MEYIPFKEESIKEIRRRQSDILKMSANGLEKEMDIELFKEAWEFVNEEMSLPVKPRALEIILSSNGYAYSSIINFGVYDTETKSAILNAISMHYMYRPFPMYKEKGFPGVDQFESRLLEEIKKSN